MSSGGNGLTGVLDTLIDESSDEQIKVDKILQTLNHRGFGPLLIAPALLAILPTGAIPGVPAICGVFIFAMSLQIFIGYRQPWLPKSLKHISFKATKAQKKIERLKPYTQKIDRYTHRRLKFLAENEISKRFIALATMLLGLAMIFVGFIPMFPALLALPVLLFALGLSVHDGILLLLGYISMSAFLCVMLWVLDSADYF
jgi:hypothetical protein